MLSGFAITVAIQLLSVAKRNPSVTAAMAVFLISSVDSAVTTFIFVTVMTGVIGPPGFQQSGDVWIVHLAGGIGVLPFVGHLRATPASTGPSPQAFHGRLTVSGHRLRGLE